MFTLFGIVEGCKRVGDFYIGGMMIRATNEWDVEKNFNHHYKQSGRMKKIGDYFLHQNQSVRITEISPDDPALKPEFEARKARNQLTPTVTVQFELNNGVLTCRGIELESSLGQKALSLESIKALGDLDSLARDAVRVWTSGQIRQKAWELHPVDLEEFQVREQVKANREAGQAFSNGLYPGQDDELKLVAKVYAENYRTGTEALMKVFGYSKGTAHNRRRKAIEKGILPAHNSSPEDYALALKKLATVEVVRTNDEIKAILKKMKSGEIPMKQISGKSPEASGELA
jgi:hypothetical protein